MPVTTSPTPRQLSKQRCRSCSSGARGSRARKPRAATRGGLTVNGRPLATGLSMKVVQPALETLNLAQLRIQDELERRGVAGVAIPGRLGRRLAGGLRFVCRRREVGLTRRKFPLRSPGQYYC